MLRLAVVFLGTLVLLSLLSVWRLESLRGMMHGLQPEPEQRVLSTETPLEVEIMPGTTLKTTWTSSLGDHELETTKGDCSPTPCPNESDADHARRHKQAVQAAQEELPPQGG